MRILYLRDLVLSMAPPTPFFTIIVFTVSQEFQLRILSSLFSPIQPFPAGWAVSLSDLPGLGCHQLSVGEIREVSIMCQSLSQVLPMLSISSVQPMSSYYR